MFFSYEGKIYADLRRYETKFEFYKSYKLYKLMAACISLIISVSYVLAARLQYI
jgi:hypothetical protein